MPSVFLRVLVASTLISLVTGPVSAEQPKSEVKIEHTSEDWSAGNGTFPGVTFGGEPGDKVSMIKVTCELGEEVLKQAPIDRGGQMKHCSLVTAINPPPPKVANNISIQLDCNDGGTPASTLHCITVSRINPPMLQTWGHY
ncbi:MAG: hypothetical protein ACE5D3_09420, partial [Candidatus Binatia bacterium]